MSRRDKVLEACVGAFWGGLIGTGLGEISGTTQGMVGGLLLGLVSGLLLALKPFRSEEADAPVTAETH
jgi:hypothetical protein